MATLMLFFCGVAGTIYLVPLISFTQRQAPDYMRGRVMATRFLVAQTGLLIGMAIAGPLTDRVGAPAVFATAGLLLMATAGLGFAAPNLRRTTLDEGPEQPNLKVLTG